MLVEGGGAELMSFDSGLLVALGEICLLDGLEGFRLLGMV